MSTIYTVDWTQFLGPDSELPPDITFTVIQSSGTYKGRSRNCQAYEISMLFVWSSCPQIDPRWSQPCVQEDVLLLCNLRNTLHHGERGHRNYGFRVLCFPKYDHIYLFKGNADMNGLHAMMTWIFNMTFKMIPFAIFDITRYIHIQIMIFRTFVAEIFEIVLKRWKLVINMIWRILSFSREELLRLMWSPREI